MERVRDLGKDVDIVGRTLLFLFAGFNTFFVFFAKEKGRIKHFAADFIFWVRVKDRSLSMGLHSGK